ncbi:4-hydroxythreonine-4-phosphate dehydrogenase PdxA [uncultured Clostridium sp.]|uniref:4-hydroxythreonine-4-phosphate dehydrogenase PdxA n=1 Tax=uncultured Clostridium sp. TaxID=59620 RepID=UPI0025FDCB97|nr:4-hydroxythreonine-4-phosphate dehydrogenase PdxA [uncultured Clostridium sp.]
MKKQRIVIPMGDPAGVGPEIVVKAIADPTVWKRAESIVIGDRGIIEKAIELTNSPVKVNVLTSQSEGNFSREILNLIDLQNIDMNYFEYGKVNGMCGRAAYGYIEESVRLALERRADAVVTPPINKESLRLGNILYIGHTEIFGALSGTKDPLTMFETKGLRVFFLTRHVSLRTMLDMIKKDRIKDYVRRCKKALERLGVDDGIMAIAGLNPHSGEHGLFGTEEMEEIIPAVEELKQEGYKVEGPIGADSVFHQAALGKYNSVLSLYHDQGHIATKTLDFERTVAVTNGMPFLRTSVDHGTAFDIAGTGEASAVSMKEAIFVAVKYASFFHH